jgi:hypothetical protein
MNELEKYKRWLQARGVETPSEVEVERFKKKARRRPYGSLLELILAVWLDSRGKCVGTQGWLKAQGLMDPSDDDLAYFGRKIKRAVLWRGSFVLLLAAAWVCLFWIERIPLRGVSAVTPFALIVCGLAVSLGTRLPKGKSTSRLKLPGMRRY